MLTLYITEIYDRAKRNAVTEVCAPEKRVPWQHSEHRVQSGILFTLRIHTRGTSQRAGGIHVPKKTGRMLGSSIQEGRLARLRGAA